MFLMFALANIFLPFVWADPVSITIGFDAQSSNMPLEGVKSDVKVYEKRAEASGIKNYTFLETDFTAAGSKEDFLNKLLQSIGDSDPVIFNYSGHGVNTALPQQPAPLSNNYSIDETLKAIQARKNLSSSAQPLANGPSRFVAGTNEMLKCVYGCDQTGLAKCQANYMRQEKNVDLITQKCLNGCNKNKACRNACYDSPEYSKAYTETTTVASTCRSLYEGTNQYHGACAETCVSKYGITAEDLARVFKGKTVIGFVDACYAGALQSLPHDRFALLVASQYNEETNDTASGGQSRIALDQLITSLNCNGATNATQIKYSDIFDSLSKVPTGYHVVTSATAPTAALSQLGMARGPCEGGPRRIESRPNATVQ